MRFFKASTCIPINGKQTKKVFEEYEWYLIIVDDLLKHLALASHKCDEIVNKTLYCVL